MRLRYRGIAYTYYPPELEATEQQMVGQYRGVLWRSPIIRVVNCSQPLRILKFRGVLYARGDVTLKKSFSDVE
jgi:Domain of unknown function (DUF4278)